MNGARRLGLNPAARLETGATILAAANILNTALVKRRLAAFTRAHRRYVQRQRHVEAAKAELRKARGRLALYGRNQHHAVEALARALVTDGQPRANPFAAFQIVAPSLVKHTTPGATAKAVRQLTAAVQRRNTVSNGTCAAIRDAEQAARTVEAALLAVQKLRDILDQRRRVRNAGGHTWETTLAALKRGARAAADDGAPRLYGALFDSVTRSHKRKMVRPRTASGIGS